MIEKWQVHYCDDERFMCMTAISAVPVSGSNDHQYSDFDPNDMVAIVYHQCNPAVCPDDSDKADKRARLIAAALELLAVAKAIMDAFESYERFGEICTFEGNPMIYAETLVNLADVARAAIAKATGEEA